MVDQPQKSDKRVVIVGGGFSGTTIAERLWNNAHVTLIDKKDHFEYFIINFRVLIKQHNYDEISIKYEDYRKAHNNVFDFIQGTLTTVNKDDSITLTKADGSTQNIPYDVLIIATGFAYNEPIKSSQLTTDERKAYFDKETQKLEAAKSILVVGSGPAAMELAGEFAVAYP
jgi:NADH dehydrogenase FAD-containing subunit